MSPNCASRTPEPRLVSTRYEIYRDKALECERLAAAANSAAVKQQWIGIARQWREMADQQERALSTRLPPPD